VSGQVTPVVKDTGQFYDAILAAPIEKKMARILDPWALGPLTLVRLKEM